MPARRARAVHILRTLASLAVAAGWATLGYGMWFSPPDREAWGELEAGGRFALNFSAYAPYALLSLVVAVVVVLGLLPQPGWLSALAGMVALTALFTGWVLNRPGLLDVQPQLAGYAVLTLVIDAAALLFLVPAGRLSAAEPATSEA
jgi:hypothetical protein